MTRQRRTSRTGRVSALPESPPSYDSLFPYQQPRRRSHSEPPSYELHLTPGLPTVASSSAVPAMATTRCRHCSGSGMTEAVNDTSPVSSPAPSPTQSTRRRDRQSPGTSPLLARHRSRSESAGHQTEDMPSPQPRPQSYTEILMARNPRQLVRRRSRSDPPSRDELRREALGASRPRSSEPEQSPPSSSPRQTRRRSHSGPAGYDQQRREAMEPLTPLLEGDAQSRAPFQRQRSNSTSEVRRRRSWKNKSTKRKILEGGLAAAWIPFSPLMFFIEFVVREPPRTSEDYLNDPALSVWYRAIRKFSKSPNSE